MSIRERILWKLTRLRLQPIRVFCFHHVSDERDPLVCIEEDWTQTDQFKQNILKLQSEYTFISLADAIEKLKHDTFRIKKYAVLTCDDGLKTIPFLWPWLEEHKIPLTCFINAKYLDGKSFKELDETRIRKIDKDIAVQDVISRQYMTWDDIRKLSSPMITFGMHGYEHWDAGRQTEAEFENSVVKSIDALKDLPNYVPYWAFTWDHWQMYDFPILRKYNIVPLLLRGNPNYEWYGYVDRELLDGKIF